MAVAMSLRDGSINLSNTWTRQLSETANGNVSYLLESIFFVMGNDVFVVSIEQ